MKMSTFNLPDHPQSSEDFKSVAADLYPQSQADSHRHLQERQGITPHSAPGTLAVIAGRIEQALNVLVAANLTDHQARAYAHNALSGQLQSIEAFYQQTNAGGFVE